MNVRDLALSCNSPFSTFICYPGSGYHHTEVLVEGLSTFIPDCSSQTLQDFLISSLEAFARRYNQDNRLLLLQLDFGSYADYHFFEDPFQLGETFPSMAFQERFISKANDQTQYQATARLKQASMALCYRFNITA